MRIFTATFFCLCLAVLTARVPSVQAAFGDDTDKPAPVFSRNGDAIVASLIPQGKSTKVEIRFSVIPGELDAVAGMDIDEANPGEINARDFRSALFVVETRGLAPGGKAKISIESPYFTSATQYWIFNPARSPAWKDAAAENISQPDGATELVVQATDGGPLDSDGLANGAIRLVGGPRDSFWGYALGTLFIRFFGIFLVLTILMLGLLCSSRIFRWIEGRKKSKISTTQKADTTPSTEPAITETARPPESVTPETAAAVALALHLQLKGRRKAVSPAADTESSPWVAQGRAFSMNHRLTVFDRVPFSSKRERK